MLDPEETDGDFAEFDPNEDPDGWRIYADAIDCEQIDWLRRHPQHDFGNYVTKWDEWYEEWYAGLQAQEQSRRVFSNPAVLTAQEVRELALSLPETRERELAGHPAFYVARVFAIVWPQQHWVHLLLTVKMQRELVARAPHIFSVPLQNEKDKWGESGATRVDLSQISREEMLAVLTMAHGLALHTELVFPERWL
jgi:hypothetical protein